MPTNLDPKRIRTDLDTQSRIALNDETVNEYAEAMEAGATFPPLRVFFDESNDEHILADGFHRLAAHLLVRPDDPISVDLISGTVEDARWESIGANKSHGLRRTNEDKRNAVKQALLHPKGAELSNVRIADHVGVNDKTVASVRRDLELSSEIPKLETRTVQRGDQVYQLNAAGIGSAKTTTAPRPTCAICTFFDKSVCRRDDSQPLPWTEACEHFVADEEETATSTDGSKKPSARAGKKHIHQYRHLKGCETLHLPTDNPQLFAVELRNCFKPVYLFDCMKALDYLLNDKGD